MFRQKTAYEMLRSLVGSEMCIRDSLMDVQLPGKTRVSYQHVTADKVNAILDPLFDENPSQDDLLGQFKSEKMKNWDGMAYMMDHPFFAQQKLSLIHI